MKRIIVIVCVLALLAGSLFASGQQEQKKAVEKKGPVKMIIFADIMAPVFEHLFERFEKETGYPMEIEALTTKTYKQVVASRLITKEVPDLIVNHGTPYMYLAMNPKENLVDLTAWIAENLTGKLMSKDFVASFALDGKTYGVPFTGITARAFFYNKKVMNAAGVSIPKNWHDFYENVAPKIKAAGYTPIYGMGGDKWAIGFEAENYVATV